MFVGGKIMLNRIRLLLSRLSRQFLPIFVFFIFFSLINSNVYGLQQLTNTGFTGNDNGWTSVNRVARVFLMTTFGYNANYFRGEFLSAGAGRTSDFLLEQSFLTPGQVNASINFRRYRRRTSSPWVFSLSGRLVDTSDSSYDQVFSETFNNSNYARDAWINGTWSTPVLLDGGKTYSARVYLDVTCDNGDMAGVWIDDFLCNISPHGLSASLSGGSNVLSWSASTGAATLNGATPYRIYRSITSGVYGAALANCATNGYTDAAPPAATIVFYTVTDLDTTSLESPKSVELPVVRMTISDGSGADIDFTGDSANLAVNWVDVADVTGMTKQNYEVALGTSAGATDVVAWTNVALGTSHTFTGLSLVQGTTYYPSVRIVRTSGPLNASSSDGVKYVATTLRDGSGADIDYSNDSANLTVNWDSIGAGITRYEVALGTSAGATDVVGWTNAALALNYTFTGLALVNGTKYYPSVRIVYPGPINLYLNSSDGVTYVTTTVRDGAGADITFSASVSDVALNWDAVPTAPVDHYEVAIGTSAGASDVAGWTNVGVLTSYTFTGQALTNGDVYYCSVRPVDASSAVMGTFSSNGFALAFSYGTTVRDGSGADVAYSLNQTSIDLNWDAVAINNKVRYEAALGTTVGGTEIKGWTNMGLGTSGTLNGFSLVNGTTYYCSIRIVHSLGNLSPSTSDGFVFVQPTSTVRDGVAADVDITSSLTDVTLNWDAISAFLPLDHYEVALGTTVGGAEIVAWTNAGTGTSYTFTGLSLTNGGTYYCSMRAVDTTAAVMGTFTSDGFSPAVSYSTTVRDGTGSDIDFSLNESSISLNWDNVVITKVRYEAALGTTPGGSDVVGWTDMALATSGNLTGFTLVSGTTYYCSVRIVLSAGPLPADSSDGFQYAAIEVRDGPGADVDFTFLPDTVELNWDAPPFAVQKYEVAIGTTIGGTELMNWTDAGTVTSTSFSGLPLVQNSVYFCSVRVYDAGGALLGFACSDGFEALIPTTVVVRDGLGPDIATTHFDNRVELNWDYVNANIIRYEVAVGTSKFSDNIFPWTEMGTVNQAAVTTPANLASGTIYYASVRGINNFKAMEAIGSSDGFVARRDPVLVDTASQSYFHNARVLNMIDTTTDAGSIRPKIFSGGAGAGYWRYSMPVTVQENNITDRVNAPCRVTFAIPGAQQPNAIGEFRVADSAGNEVPRYNMAASTIANPDLVFTVNIKAGETKTYWIYWGNTGVTTTETNYHFTQNASLTSNIEWTPYYSRKNLPPGQEDVGAYDFDFGNRGDDIGIQNFNLNWDFYFFGTLRRNGWDVTTNGVLTTASSWFGDYTNTWNEFIRTGADTTWTCMITPIWIDLRTGPIPPAPADAGIYRDYLTNPDRVVFTWVANRYTSDTDIYRFQAVLYRSGDIALRYFYLSPLGLYSAFGTDNPVNVAPHYTVGISNTNNSNWLRNTPLAIGTNNSPTAFYQYMDAMTVTANPADITGGAVGTWVSVSHIESMVFDSKVTNPQWATMTYECSGDGNNRLLLSTRSGPTPLPDGSWTAWSAETAAIVNGSYSLTAADNANDRYIQYRCRFQRMNNAGTLPILGKVEFTYGGISIEEIKANTPDGVSQGQTGIPVEVVIRNNYGAQVDLQSVELNFSLGNHTYVRSSPALLPVSINANDVVSVFFNVDVDINSPTGTATVDARATATVTLPALTFSDDSSQITKQWRIRSRAQLVINQVETDRTFVNKGEEDIYVRMHISNTGETPFSLTAADLNFTVGLYDPPLVLQSPPIGTVIQGLSSFIATFTVNIDPLSPSGNVSIGGSASGTNTFSGELVEDFVEGSVPPITDQWTIQNPAELVIEEIVASSTVYRGQTNTPVFIRVSNGGEATARWLSSSIIPYLTLGLYDDEYPITSFEILLGGGFEATARYGVDISPVSPVGTSDVDASVLGKDLNTGANLTPVGAAIPTQWTILAAKINTFKDSALTQQQQSFNRPSAGTITIFAKAESLPIENEYVIRWLDQSDNIIAASPPLSSPIGELSHQMDITSTSNYGFYRVRVTNPINTIIYCENQFEITSPAILGSYFSMPAKVSVGQPFTASFTYANTGGADIDSAYTSALQVFGPGTANQVGGMPPVTDVPGNGQATVTFNFVAAGAGNFSASATAYGFDANSGAFLTSPAVTSNICLIQTAPVVQNFSITATPDLVYLNQKNLLVTVNVRNTGQATAIIEAASLTFSIGTFDQTLTSPVLPYSLTGGSNVNLVYDVSVAPDSAVGNSVFTSNVFWYDQNWPASSTWLQGSPPQDDWDIVGVGIKLSRDEDFAFEQEDFCRSQRMFIRAYLPGPDANWYRLRIYNTQIPYTVNVPTSQVLSPLLAADSNGYVDFYYDIPAAAGYGVWSVALEDDNNQNAVLNGGFGAMLGLQYFKVQARGNLVASLTISPLSVFVGENFTVTMLASNTVAQSSTISNASPSLLVSASAFPNFGGSATQLSGPTPASVTVETQQTKTMIWTYRADSDTGITASYALTVSPTWYASGYDLNDGSQVFSNKAVSNHLTIYSRRLLLSPDSLDLASLNCGETGKVDCTVANIGNYPLDHIKWITTDLNGPPGEKISKSNLIMSPDPLNGLAGGANKAGSATLFIPYNKVAGDYIATMSVYNDRDQDDMADIDEAYDQFNIKVKVLANKKIFTVQQSIDLGAWPIGQTTPGNTLNFFSGGNIALTNVKLMQLPGVANGTNTFTISATPNNPGALAITGSGISSIVANNVDTAGIYIATWTIWDDSTNPAAFPWVVDPDEASDTFQVRVQVGVMNFVLNPTTVDAGSVEPSGLNLGFSLDLTNDPVGLPLTKLKLQTSDLTVGPSVIASSNIAIYTVNNPIPAIVNPGQTIPVDLALFVPAGSDAGTYSGVQYIYHDDNGSGKWEAGEFRMPFTLQVTVPAVPKVQVMVGTVGVGGITPGTSKIVNLTCRNTGNVDLTGLRWVTVNLVGPDTIPAINASFPPSELFSVLKGEYFTRQLELTVPAGKPYGFYESIPNHFWIWADMPVDGVRDPLEASCSFKVTCDVGELVVDIVETSLAVIGSPNGPSTASTVTALNNGSLSLVNIMATGSALILTPPVAGADNILASRNVFSPVNLGGANAGQQKTTNWSVNIPANASAGVYLGTVTVWEDANYNGLKDTGEAFSDCPAQLTVKSTPAIDVIQSSLDLGWMSKNSSKSGQIEIHNAGNIALNSVNLVKAMLINGANNIPVASITFQTIPAMPFSLGVGASTIATVTVTIGAVQATVEYRGNQRIFEDLAPAGWDAGDASDIFELIVSVGNKVIYETAVGNPPLAFGARDVNGTYNIPVTVYSGSNVPLERVTWKLISPFTSPTYTFPVASLTFTPAQGVTQGIGGLGNRTWQANAEVGFADAGNYVATAAFFDDSVVMNGDIDANEASATFQITLTVNPVDGIDLLETEIDFGTIAAGASKTVGIWFQNTGNYAIDIADLAWAFSDIASLTLPAQAISLANIDVLSYTYSPVPPNGIATANVRLYIPPAQVKDTYGPSGPQRLSKGTSQDTCDFKVVVGGEPAAAVEQHSLFQNIATLTFSPQIPPSTDLYFLSAWVCPGSGSADIAFVQYDVDGKPVATVSVRVDQFGQLTKTEFAGFPIQYAGIVDTVPITIEGLDYNYYRVYLAFNYTFNDLTASSTRLILHNSSAVPQRSVWFDGIKLERAFEGQTRPTTYHPGATLHSPVRERALQGGHQYYEW